MWLSIIATKSVASDATGGRKPHLLAIEDKLLFILFYYKVHPLQEVIAAFFGMSQGRANEWIHKLSPILERALGETRRISSRSWPFVPRWTF